MRRCKTKYYKHSTLQLAQILLTKLLSDFNSCFLFAALACLIGLMLPSYIGDSTKDPSDKLITDKACHTGEIKIERYLRNK